MREYLGEYDNMLIFADEDFKSMNTNEFALFCKFTDSFFVLLCRDPLHRLPYSYEGIYTIKTSGRFHELMPVFSKEDFLKFYEDRKILTEDSNAGFEFFSYFYNNVKSAKGKSKLNGLLDGPGLEIVADGAAFGCEIERVLWTIHRNGLDTKLFLPESFEYLILSSELFKQYTETSRISDPVQIISGLYFSWEQYFTQLLTELSEKLANNYSKSVLNECYYRPCCCKDGKACNMKPTARKKEAVLGRYLGYENDKSSERKTQKLNVF